MLKFNLTQEGKTAIANLQNNDKLAITHVRLSQSGDSPSVDLPISRGAIVVDGTCNGPYAVVDVNDTSDNHYLASAITLLSDTKSIAELYSDEKASGYEVVLSAGVPGRTAYPSIKYRTQTWASGKIPSRVDIMKGTGDDCDILLSFGSKGGDPGDPSQQEVSAKLTLGDNFPKNIAFSNGDIWETDDTVSTTGVKNSSYSYGASSENGETSIRPLYSKISIEKDSNKQLKLRLSCQFDGAEKCKFNTTSINLPYATRFREGVIRLADPSEVYGKDGQRYNTVYSAADVDTKINQVTSSLGNLNQYAKKAEANEFTAVNTFTAGITVNGEIGGNAVTAAGENGDKHIVNVGYADGKYLSKTEAGSTYLTQENAAATYLKKTDAENAAANYAKLNVDNEFAANTTNTFKGDVTVNGIFAVGASQDGAHFMVSEYGISGTEIQNDKVDDPNSNKLPTEGAVKSALNDVESALTTKDNELQSQIDGINAGQNLADIVNNTTELAGYAVSHLKAKDDYQHGESGATWDIGDKVQVLGGGEVQSSVYELRKGPMPGGEGSKDIQSTNNTNYYWHYIGVYGTNAYTKSEINTKVDEINNAISTKADKSYVDTELGKKANSADVYSTTEADNKFAVKTGDNTFNGNNTFNGAIIGSAVTSDIAKDITEQGDKLTTSTGVSSFVNTVVDTKISNLNLDGSYLKLNSDEVQTVNSNVDFNGTIGGTAVTPTQMTESDITQSGDKIVSLGFAEIRYANLGDDNKFLGKLNEFQTIKATKIEGSGVATQISSNGGERLPTEDAVISFVGAKLAENRRATSDKTKVGAMGLFLYTGGDLQEMGTEVDGTLLQAVGMQLPMDGVVSWSQGAQMPGRWKLLNNTIAGEPCLVLAIRVG